MIFYFQESENNNKDVPFDVSPLAYDKIVDSAEIDIATKARIQTILSKAQNGVI